MLTTIQTYKGSSKVVTFAMLFLDFSEGPRACVTTGFLKPRVTAAILGARNGLASAVLLLNDRATAHSSLHCKGHCADRCMGVSVQTWKMYEIEIDAFRCFVSNL